MSELFDKVPAELDFPAEEAKILAFWKEQPHLREDAARRDARHRALEGHVRLLRGPADRERHAAQRPRPHARRQGRLPSLQDHARLRRRRGRRAGTRTACPSRSRSRRSSASTARRTSSAYGVEPFIARCIDVGLPLHRRSGRSSPTRSASGSTSTSAYVTYHRSYVESVWWALSELLQEGPALPGPQGRLVVAAGRHRALARPRSARLQDRRRPERRSSRSRSSDEPDTALAASGRRPLDPAVEHVRGGATRVRLRRRRRRRVPASSIVAAALREALAKKLKRDLPVVERAARAGARRQALPSAVRRLRERALRQTHGRSSRTAAERRSTGACIAADFVTLDAGTGIVHVAPAFGEDDFEAHRAELERYADPTRGAAALRGEARRHVRPPRSGDARRASG